MGARFRSLWRNLFRRKHVEQRLNDEVKSCVEILTDQQVAAGASPHDARRRALLELGGVEQVKEQARDARLGTFLESIWRDLRIGVRLLIRTPAFSATAALSLALGIGLNTAVFSIVNAVLLTPLPYHEPERLVMIWPVPPDGIGRPQATATEFLAWQRHASAFEAMATEGQLTRELGADENGAAAETVPAQNYTSSMFTVLGVRPILGRFMGAEHDPVDNPAPVVVISEGLWRRRYHSDPNVVGNVIRMDGTPVTIIGVMPAQFGFWDTRRVDIWAPLSFTRSQIQGVTGRSFVVIARLKSGASLAQAQADMDAIASAVTPEVPNRPAGWTARVQPLDDVLNGPFAQPLLIFQSAVGLVLLIACANVAGLLLSRATYRSREVAVRAAMGAGRWRVLRQLLTESAVLAVAGGVLGLALGWTGIKVLVALSPGTIPRLDSATIDTQVLAFTALAVLFTGLLFGVLPAVHGSRSSLVTALVGGSKGATDGGQKGRLRNGLVTVQIALAIVLLVSSGLLIRTVANLRTNDLGADPTDVLTFDLRFSRTVHLKNIGTHAGVPLHEVSPVPATTFDQVWTSIRKVPGVIAASASNVAPLGGNVRILPFSVDGRAQPETPEERRRQSAGGLIITPSYFETMSIPILRGRDFGIGDTATSPWVVVINEAMARTFWPGENALGRELTIELVPNDRPRQIVGIVRDHLLSPFDEEARPVMYTLHTQQPVQYLWPRGELRLGMSFLVKTRDTANVVPALRRVIADIDRDRPIGNIHPLEQDLASRFTTHRYVTTLFGTFASVATFLAAIGIYGVMAFTVARRSREIGIRMALGARARDVLRLVGRQVMLVLCVGLVLGLGGALAATRVLEGILWGVLPNDPSTFIVVAVLMAGVTVGACLVPLSRALRVAPTVALRAE